VRQYDLSLEDPPVKASYGPVRWVPLFSVPDDVPVPVVGEARFDSPVGSDAERAGAFATGAVAFGRYPIWAGAWFDFNPYLSWYSYGYHTGADLNLPGGSAADKGKPIYAVGDGLVTYAGDAGSWGNIVVVEHPEALVSLPSGGLQVQKVYTRYGHVDDNIQVKKGQVVTKGQKIAFVGLPAGQTTGWHLHFDVSYSDLLKSRPAHWPNMSTIRALQKANVKPSSARFKKAQAAVMREVVKHYVDPLRFIKDNHS
jgi:murein DD-endopeptidase MepM/ murein hydrolase activator NlpD